MQSKTFCAFKTVNKFLYSYFGLNNRTCSIQLTIQIRFDKWSEKKNIILRITPQTFSVNNIGDDKSNKTTRIFIFSNIESNFIRKTNAR